MSVQSYSVESLNRLADTVADGLLRRWVTGMREGVSDELTRKELIRVWLIKDAAPHLTRLQRADAYAILDRY